MISKEDAPSAWLALQYELEDAHEQLGRLVADMELDADYDEARLSADLALVYAHLNRAWYRRQCVDDLSDEQWMQASQFPGDLPLG